MRQVRMETKGKMITVGRGCWNELAHRGMIRIESRFLEGYKSMMVDSFTAKQCRKLADAFNKLADEIDEIEEVF